MRCRTLSHEKQSLTMGCSGRRGQRAAHKSSAQRGSGVVRPPPLNPEALALRNMSSVRRFVVHDHPISLTG
jgi:hypothetical protein